MKKISLVQRIGSKLINIDCYYLPLMNRRGCRNKSYNYLRLVLWLGLQHLSTNHDGDTARSWSCILARCADAAFLSQVAFFTHHETRSSNPSVFRSKRREARPPSKLLFHHRSSLMLQQSTGRLCRTLLELNDKGHVRLTRQEEEDERESLLRESLSLELPQQAPSATATSSTPCLVLHHAAIKTRNISTAIDFYSLLGYQVICRFRAGPARAAWLQLASSLTASTEDDASLTAADPIRCRLELIEVPSYVLNETSSGTTDRRIRAVDLMQRQELLGYNHVALDVTAQIRSGGMKGGLSEWMQRLNDTSLERFGKSLRVALHPRQQMIGRSVYELAFLYDADGALIELLHHQRDLEQTIESGWEPWDGRGNFLQADKGFAFPSGRS